MEKKDRLCDLMMMVASLLLVLTLFTSCATDISRLSEIAPDGTKFKSSRATISTLGSKHDRSSGGISYSGVSSDGASFDLSTGHDVTGQLAGDGTGALSVLVGLAGKVLDNQAGEKPAAPEPRPAVPSLEEAVELLRSLGLMPEGPVE